MENEPILLLLPGREAVRLLRDFAGGEDSALWYLLSTAQSPGREAVAFWLTICSQADAFAREAGEEIYSRLLALPVSGEKEKNKEECISK